MNPARRVIILGIGASVFLLVLVFGVLHNGFRRMQPARFGVAVRAQPDLLEQVFADFPDAEFLDEMLLLWAQVGFRMGDNEIARQKLQQLIFDYPSSKHVAEAQKKLAALKKD